MIISASRNTAAAKLSTASDGVISCRQEDDHHHHHHLLLLLLLEQPSEVLGPDDAWNKTRSREGGDGGGRGRDLKQLCAVMCGKSAVYYHTTHHITRTLLHTPLTPFTPGTSPAPTPRKMHTRMTLHAAGTHYNPRPQEDRAPT